MRLIDPYIEGVRKVDELMRLVNFYDETAEIDAKDLKHKELNDLMKECVLSGAKRLVLRNVCGQRYIGSRLFFNPPKKVEIEIYGTPGNDLGAFLAGHKIVVYGNAQDGVGNTMDDGEIIVHGRAGDVVAMCMRGGRVFIRDYVGYRCAIHMKGYKDKVPVLVIGQTAQDFLGEYMAGGKVVLLGLGVERHRCYYIGTGMHGGVMFIRGTVEEHQLGKEVGIVEMEEEDWKFLEEVVKDYCRYFGMEGKEEEILGGKFLKLVPVSKRPYGRVYSY
ncbi:GltB/FmdC/FwdC-like GXGXG domain-containing protein [Archaeoglobus sp.]